MNFKNLAIIEAVAIIAIVGVAGVLVITAPPTQAPITLNGSGATFPAPMYQRWSQVYQGITGVRINYVGVGSGTGVANFKAKTTDFGGSDPPMSHADWIAAPGALHIPMVIGGVVIVTHISSLGTQKLNFTGSVIAAIYARNITMWNDANITSLNPSASLPAQAIVAVHRSDSSGTTKVFTSFLSNESIGWKAVYGAANVISWPSQELGGQGNPGVTSLVQQTDYSIGYVELQYGLSATGVVIDKVANPTGKYIDPSLTSLQAAANAWSFNLPQGNASWENVPAFFNLRTAGVVPDDAYPITNPTYILVYRDMSVVPGMTLAKAQALAHFISWAIHDGQLYCAALSYVRLPASVVSVDEATLQLMNFAGTPLLSWS